MRRFDPFWRKLWKKKPRKEFSAFLFVYSRKAWLSVLSSILSSYNIIYVICLTKIMFKIQLLVHRTLTTLIVNSFNDVWYKKNYNLLSLYSINRINLLNIWKKLKFISLPFLAIFSKIKRNRTNLWRTFFLRLSMKFRHLSLGHPI